MQLSHNNAKRRRQVMQAASDGDKIAEFNRRLEVSLRQLEAVIPHCTDPEEKEQGLAMIRRLKRELGEDVEELAC